MKPSISSSNGSCELGVLTPYLVPGSLRGRKVVNIGDGFILRAIERWVGQFSRGMMFSPRVALHEDELDVLERSPAIILAGANQLTDHYTIWPGLTAERIRRDRMRLVPFGIGLHGNPKQTEQMTPETRAVLEAVHEHIEYSSWRCPRTVAFLRRELPERAGQFLMTGCPVIYDHPLLESDRFCSSEAAVAVTATERGEFWDRETQVIDAVAKRFRNSRRYFVTHQNVSPPAMFEGIRHRVKQYAPGTYENRVEALRLYARQQGFRIVIPSSADECMKFYENVDVHVGSRLHAHLLFLSRNKRSYLVSVDDRSLGVSEHLGFPLLSSGQLDRGWDCDLEIVRVRARESYTVMERFVKSLDYVQTHNGT